MSAGQPINVVIVEDHASTRNAIKQALGDYAARIRVVDVYPNAESFMQALAVSSFDVALVDLGLPNMSGSELIRRLSAERPEIRSIALTVFTDEKTVLATIKAGAYGYLLKDEPSERLVQSIEEAAAGQYPFSSRIAGLLVSWARLTPDREVLSEREEELARKLADGLSYAECARSMDIKIGTVQNYVKRLYRKLDVSSRKGVRTWAERHLENI